MAPPATEGVPPSSQHPLVAKIIAAILSLIITSLVVPGMLVRMLYYGPFSYFKPKSRPTKPKCLEDPTLGKHQFVTSNGVSLHCVVNGPEGAPLMLFLHGFPEMWYAWQHQIREFSRDYRTVAVDMRGYGESEKPPGIDQYLIEKLAKDIADLIPALGYEQCVLVSHDWGGFVAQYVTAFYPSRIERLVMCNVPHTRAFMKVLTRSFKQLLMSWYMFFFQSPYIPELWIKSRDYGFISDAMLSAKSYADKPLISEDTLEAIKYSLNTPNGTHCPVNYYRALFQYKSARLPRVMDTPCLLVWGIHDMVLSEAMAGETGNYFKHFMLRLVDDAGHWVQNERPLATNRYIREFLSTGVDDVSSK